MVSFRLPFTKKNTLHVLVIEDNDDDALLLIRQLQRAGYSVEHERVDTAAALERSLQRRWDLVLADYSMPTMSGIEALRKVRAANSELPFIFVSGTIGEELAVEAIRMGAQDYVLKDSINRLPVVVRRELEDARTRTGRRKAEQQLNYLARYDSFTGLPNLFTLRSHLKQLIDQRPRGNSIILVAHIQLDSFSAINDSLGHEAGITFLQETGNRLQRFIQNKGMVARLSNQEFALVHTGFSLDDSLEQAVQNLVHSLAAPHTLKGVTKYDSVRIGVAVYPAGAFDSTDLLNKAEAAALSLQKSSGASARFFDPSMSDLLEQRAILRRDLRGALEKNEFFLRFQPQIHLADGEIAALAALLEWHDAERGFTKREFSLSDAEETGFIFSLGEWTLRQVCQQLKLWEYAGIDCCVAVAVASRQFQEDNLVDLLDQTLKEFDIPPSHLRLEITEAAIMRNSENARQILEEIRKLGVKVALENFGGNYSNLAYLKNFVSDFISLGSDFVDALGKTPDAEETFTKVLTMARRLGIKTIAKGVETLGQYAWLKTSGCDFVQGSFIGRPVEASVIRDTLLHRAGTANFANSNQELDRP